MSTRTYQARIKELEDGQLKLIEMVRDLRWVNARLEAKLKRLQRSMEPEGLLGAFLAARPRKKKKL